MPSPMACWRSAFQRAGPAAGNSLGASPTLSRYSQITGLSNSETPSSVTRVGTLFSGLNGVRPASAEPIIQSSNFTPRLMAQAVALRT